MDEFRRVLLTSLALARLTNRLSVVEVGAARTAPERHVASTAVIHLGVIVEGLIKIGLELEVGLKSLC